MPYDTRLADRVRILLLPLEGFSERKMFGGVCFMLHGNMACGIVHDLLIVRVGTEKYADALRQQHARMFDFTGRPMTGWVRIDPGGTDTDDSLAFWIRKGVDTACKLPPKTPKSTKRCRHMD
jgi:TfoX/Sxy family transcriptional regulator of competence genes